MSSTLSQLANVTTPVAPTAVKPASASQSFLVNICNECHKTEADLGVKAGDFKQCAGCASVFYCGQPHQKADWKTHKTLCKAITALKTSYAKAPAKNNGFAKTIVTAAAGPNAKLKPKKSDEITLHFTGKLSCGVVFEDSRVIQQPLKIKIGKRSLIRGLDDGIQTMSVGERAEFLILPEWAYGDKAWQSNAPPRIPTHLPLLFDVTLLAVEDKHAPEYDAILEEQKKRQSAAAAVAPAAAAAAPAPATAAAATPAAGAAAAPAAK